MCKLTPIKTLADYRLTDEEQDQVMPNNAKLLEISKLVFELTMVGSTDNDLDVLLEQLFSVLHYCPVNN